MVCLLPQTLMNQDIIIIIIIVMIVALPFVCIIKDVCKLCRFWLCQGGCTCYWIFFFLIKKRKEGRKKASAVENCEFWFRRWSLLFGLTIAITGTQTQLKQSMHKWNWSNTLSVPVLSFKLEFKWVEDFLLPLSIFQSSCFSVSLAQPWCNLCGWPDSKHQLTN